MAPIKTKGFAVLWPGGSVMLNSIRGDKKSSQAVAQRVYDASWASLARSGYVCRAISIEVPLTAPERRTAAALAKRPMAKKGVKKS